MIFKGKIIVLSEEESGTSQTTQTAWRRRRVVVEQNSTRPRRLAFDAWGDLADKAHDLGIGAQVIVSFEVDAREYQGRWYTEAQAFDLAANL